MTEYVLGMRSPVSPKAPCDLRKARAALDLTRVQLASRARVSYSTVVRCEQRNVLPAITADRARYLSALGLGGE